MSFFTARKTTPQTQAKSTQRSNLSAFKARADQAVLAESIDRITGGALSGCHTGGVKMAA